MGAGQSTSQIHPPSRALHVLRVTPSSPASRTTIEPFFDFVVGFEGDLLADQNSIDASQLERIVEEHEGRTLNLLVWNSKSQQTRVVPITPSRAWSQTSDMSMPQSSGTMPQPSLLGLSMRMCEPQTAAENVWHVLDVIEGSPAESAGLVPMGDWILGWSGGVLGAENDFYDLVEAHVDKPLRVYVYSYDFDALREVVLIPNRHWGGEGLLGCVFGFGLLHRIPPQPDDRLPGTTPIELREAAEEYEEQELFVPADVHSEQQFSPEQVAEWRRKEQEQWQRDTAATRTMYNHPQHQSQSSIGHTLDHEHDFDHDHTHGHDHDYDHGHEHEHHDHYHSHDHSGHSSTSHLGNQGYLPRPQPAFDDSRTPTRTSAGRLMNGTALAQNLSRGLSAGADKATPKFEGNGSDGNEDEDGYDGETSVAGTETSRGSLTSVD